MKSRLGIACISLFAIVVSASGADGDRPNVTMGSVRQMYDGHLSPEVAVTTFSHIERLFPTRTVHHGSNV